MPEAGMDKAAFGKHAARRRKFLKYPQTAVPGGPSSTYMSNIENGKLDEFTEDTVIKLARGLQWEQRLLEKVLAGGVSFDVLPIVDEAGARDPLPQSLFDRLSREADSAQEEYEGLATSLAAAEARVDSANDRVFRFLAQQDRFTDEVRRREKELSRPLTRIEAYAIDSVDRPTARDVAEGRESYASNDAHERTRYEIALMVRIGGWTQAHAVEGSRYLDLSDAYSRVDRLLGGHPGADPDQHSEVGAEELRQRSSQVSESDETLGVAALETDPSLDEKPGGSDHENG